MGGITLPTPSTPGYTTFKDYRGRNWTACKCLAQWLGLLQRVAIKRGHIKQGLDVWQLTGGATASAGTHSQGGAFDLLFQTSYGFVMMCREFGADPTWKRTVAQGFSKDHAHGVLVGCEHNDPARYQVTAQRDGYNGLGTNGRGGKDTYPDPSPRRTWSEGVTEMKRELGLLAVATTTTAAVLPARTVKHTDSRVDAKVTPAAAGTFRLQHSTDGGKNWTNTAVPTLPARKGAARFQPLTSGYPIDWRVVFTPADATAFKASTSAATHQEVYDLDRIDRLEASLELLDKRVSTLEAPPA